jgi:pSer/pThr/pTyr-binding forkhead associated (FHA) protein
MQVESKYVSRHHAQIVTTADGSWIEDLNSTNGVFVRGKRVRRYRLQEGDVVKLGMHDLTYYRAEPAPTATVVLQDYEDEDEDAAETEDERGF